MPFTRAAALSFCLVLSPAGAFAYDGTQAEQDACTSDVFSLCSAYIPSEGPIVACLLSRRSQLSPACAQVMFPKTRPKRHRARTAKE